MCGVDCLLPNQGVLYLFLAYTKAEDSFLINGLTVNACWLENTEKNSIFEFSKR